MIAVFKHELRSYFHSLTAYVFGAFLLAFALALVYTAGVMLSNANQKLAEERCYQLAKSFAGVVDRELQKPAEQSSFRQFADKFLNTSSYNVYSPEHPETVYHYILQNGEDADYGEISLRLRKEINDDDSKSLASTIKPPEAGSETNYTEIINSKKETKFQRYIFTVEVVASYEGLTYNYATEYFREDQYPIIFSYNDMTITWDESDNQWEIGNNTSGVPCNFDADPDAEITYTYDTEHPQSTRFLPVHEEGGVSP
mgnify:FL=1